MNDVNLFGQPIASWAIPAATFVFGLACGWLGWSGRHGKDAGEEDASARVRAKAEQLNVEAALEETEGDVSAERESSEPDEKAAKHSAEPERPSVDPVQLQALELELRKAREALEAAEDSDAGLADEIKALDDAVNRANGRLKIVAKTVRKIINKS